MSPLFPENVEVTQRAQTDVPGLLVELSKAVKITWVAPAALSTNRYVTSTNMKVGAYTLANTAPDVGARNVTVTHTTVVTTDTLGTIDVVGTDLSGAVLTETITPSADATVQGVKCFKTITSITGVGWSIVGTNDTLVVGMGNKLGLPEKLDLNTVLFAFLNKAKEGTAPTVAISTTVLSQNCVLLNSALNGNDVDVFYLPNPG